MFSFGEYELDCRTGELRRSGSVLKLQPQPAKVLAVLLGRAGEVVTRQELSEQVWGPETYVDFEQGLNFAIRQIRTVLQDDAEHPHYLETIPKRGYRFIGAVSESPAVRQAFPAAAGVSSSRKKAPVYVAASVLIAVMAVFATLGFNKGWFAGKNHGIRSLAVLPLHNLSADPEQEYFSEGMTDELITDVAKVSGLRVISHTSVERYKDTKRQLPDIAHELGVDAIVEGTILRSGDRVRITAQLIDAHSDQHVWAESYERDVRDVLGLQGEVAQQIANQIGIKLTAGELTRLTTKHEVDPPAHEAYLKGAFYFDQMSCMTFEEALGYFQDAVAKDPNFAPAYSGVADSYFHLADWKCWQIVPFDKAEVAANRSLELDPGNAKAHAVLGEMAFSHDWNWRKAAEEFTRAIELDSNDAAVHSSYGMYLVAMGREEEGLTEVRKAQSLDPVSERTNLTHTWALYLAHRFDQAIDQAKQALVLFPSYGENYWLGQCYEEKGMPDQAIDFYLKAWDGLPAEPPLRRAAYQEHGLPGYWQQDEQFRKRSKLKVDAFYQAMYYAHMGEKDKALEQLKLAYQQHSDGLQFLKVEPVFDGLRDDSRFKDLISRLRL
jgi:TolB-like protein/DNA-binding winged helix-turn-helix (wHTH) protein/Flp pilus assembly protein TadD